VQHERYWAEAGRTYILASDTKLHGMYARAREVVAAMARQLKPNRATADLDDIARRELGEFYASASVYGLANGIGLNQWEAPFLSEEDARQVSAHSVGASRLNENMTVALRVVIESEEKIVIYGDSFQVTAGGAKRLGGN